MTQWDVLDMIINLFFVIFLTACATYSHLNHNKFSQFIANWFAVTGHNAVPQLGKAFMKPLIIFALSIVTISVASAYRLYHFLSKYFDVEAGIYLLLIAYVLLGVYISCRAFAIRICLAVRHHNKGA